MRLRCNYWISPWGILALDSAVSCSCITLDLADVFQLALRLGPFRRRWWTRSFIRGEANKKYPRKSAIHKVPCKKPTKCGETTYRQLQMHPIFHQYWSYGGSNLFQRPCNRTIFLIQESVSRNTSWEMSSFRFKNEEIPLWASFDSPLISDCSGSGILQIFWYSFCSTNDFLILKILNS